MTTRRTFVLSAAAAGAAFGLDKPVAFINDAHAQKAPAKKPTLLEKGFVKFKLGDIEVIQVYDGFATRTIDDKFVTNAPVDAFKAALKKGGQPGDTTFTVPYTVTFIRSKGKLVMFDSSTGGQLNPANGPATSGLMMAKNMYAAGIEPSKINHVIVTHFHPDHISGMISQATNSNVFPHADIVVPAAEFAFWNDPSKVPEAAKALGARVQGSIGKWKNVRQVADGQEVIPGVRAYSTPGHTPGHMSFVVSSGKKSMLVGGDLTNLSSVNLANPGWHIMFDADKPMAEATRRKAYDRVIADKMLVNGYHWGLPGVGSLKKDGNGYALIPLKV